MSEAHKGKVVSEEARKKLSAALTGQKRSEEARKNMSEAAKGKVMSMEARGKIGLAQVGRKKSDATKKKQSDTMKKVQQAKRDAKNKVADSSIEEE